MRAAVEPTRADDEQVARVLRLAADHWALEDIATDAGRSVVWVIETLFAHRDAFDFELAPPALN